MKKSTRCLIWLYMFSKRLFKRISFIILLCIIGIMIPVMSHMLSKETNFLKVAICSEEKCEISESAIQFLLEKDSVIEYIYYDSPENAINAVKDHKLDAAWIFKAGIEEKIASFVAGTSKDPFLEVVEREDNTLLRLSREMMFSSVFEEVSYQIYKTYAYENMTNEASFPEQNLRKIYNEMPRNGEVIEIKKMNSDDEVITEDFLTGPVRGIMSLILVLAALAGAMYFLKDQSEGKYDWLSARSRIAPAFASCFTASFFAGVAVCAAICVSSLSEGFIAESIRMMLFVLAASGFALNFCIVFKSYGKLGAFLPGIIIALLALSPVFLNVTSLKILQLLVPNYYYLNASVDGIYVFYMIIYCICVYALAAILNICFRRKDKKHFVI